MSGPESGPPGRPGAEPDPETVRNVLASIRELVSAEASARIEAGPDSVLMLTREMRIDLPAEIGGADEGLGAGLDLGPPDRTQPHRPPLAPLFDEAALRAYIDSIVREELQGELGERIARNLRKLVRREIAQMLDERDALRLGTSEGTTRLAPPPQE
jgi:hypothetical protein